MNQPDQLYQTWYPYVKDSNDGQPFTLTVLEEGQCGNPRGLVIHLLLDAEGSPSTPDFEILFFR